MAEIKTPNWRLSSCAPTSTGNHYLIKDRRTNNVTYFDTVRVYDGGLVNEVKLYHNDEPMPSGRSRAGIIRNTEQFDTVILDALKALENGDTITSLGTRVEA
jgi:hypothetical protein